MTVSKLLLVEVETILHVVLWVETRLQTDETVPELCVVNLGGSDGDVRLAVRLDGDGVAQHGGGGAEAVLHHRHGGPRPGHEVRLAEVTVHGELLVLGGDCEAGPGVPHTLPGGEASALDSQLRPGVKYLPAAVRASEDRADTNLRLK